jgi:malic enzyme
MATGRSDYPNQINIVLAFPGVFKRAIVVRARTISEEMKLAAAHAIARLVPEEELLPDYIIPERFQPAGAGHVSSAAQGDLVEPHPPSDLERSLRFYEQTLGLAVYREWAARGGDPRAQAADSDSPRADRLLRTRGRMRSR